MSQAARNRVGSAQPLPPSKSAARAFIARALTASAGKTGTASVTVRAPAAKVSRLASHFEDKLSLLWRSPDGSSICGIGTAVRVDPDATSVRDFFSKQFRIVAPDVERVQTRLFGGLSFDGKASDALPWKSFGAGGFFCPVWAFIENGLDNLLQLHVSLADLNATRMQRHLQDFDELWDALNRPSPTIVKTVFGKRVKSSDTEEWNARVSAISAQIRAGEFEKVVAARHCLVQFDDQMSAVGVWDRLASRFSDCTTFAVFADDSVFIGASPERLVRRSGARVSTEAMAGSVAHGGAQRLLQNAKERSEHRLVVEAIVDALSTYCDRVDATSEPTVLELPNVLHMRTPIEGHLRDDVHILDLVNALHPTPAVGGVPTHKAVSWINEHEKMPRGWYSAPLGWIDAEGDGEFVVALRSGVIADNQAWIFAGGGIMAESDPTAEYEETELKMQALLGALTAPQ